MSVNVELLERTMRHIEDHPSLHDQETWVSECGSAACFAGWACLLSGWQVQQSRRGRTMIVHPDTLEEDSPPDVARKLLGLSAMDAALLFAPDNTRDMLALMVKALVNGESLGPFDDDAPGGVR